MSAETIRRLYDAFARHDGDAMAACYAPGATFEDPVFSLRGGDVGDMWRMLTEPKSVTIDAEVLGDDRASWTADYALAGRRIHNEIESRFRFDEGSLIVAQEDTFDFPAWARQALGWRGRVLGRFARSAVRKGAAARLARWQAERRAP